MLYYNRSLTLINPFPAKNSLYYFTLSNAGRFYSSVGDPGGQRVNMQTLKTGHQWRERREWDFSVTQSFSKAFEVFLGLQIEFFISIMPEAALFLLEFFFLARYSFQIRYLYDLYQSEICLCKKWRILGSPKAPECMQAYTTCIAENSFTQSAYMCSKISVKTSQRALQIILSKFIKGDLQGRYC